MGTDLEKWARMIASGEIIPRTWEEARLANEILNSDVNNEQLDEVQEEVRSGDGIAQDVPI